MVVAGDTYILYLIEAQINKQILKIKFLVRSGAYFLNKKHSCF